MNAKQDDSLYKNLISLSRQIIAELKKLEIEGRFTKKQLLYEKPKVNTFTYNDGGNISYSSTLDHVIKEVKFLENRSEFVESKVKQIPEYSPSVKAIAKRKSCSPNEAISLLDRLVRHFEGSDLPLPDGDDLSEIIATFIGDIDVSPTTWSVMAFLQGIWLKDNSYEIGDDIVVRRLDKSDIETDAPLHFSGTIFPFGRPLSPAVLELSLIASQSMQVQKELDIFITLLRLFRLGSIITDKYVVKPKSITRISRIMGESPVHAAHYKYELNSSNAAELRLFLPKMKPLIPVLSHGLTPDTDSIVIALDRYSDALTRHGGFESRITSGITALESLFLKPDERMELTHRLAQRVSNLFRLLGSHYRPLEIYTKLCRAYDIRSTFIHGSSTKKEHRQSLSELCEIVMQFARISLLTFIQMKPALEKDQLVTKLDNSLLDSNAHDKLSRLIAETVRFKS